MFRKRNCPPHNAKKPIKLNKASVLNCFPFTQLLYSNVVCLLLDKAETCSAHSKPSSRLPHSLTEPIVVVGNGTQMTSAAPLNKAPFATFHHLSDDNNSSKSFLFQPLATLCLCSQVSDYWFKKGIFIIISYISNKILSLRRITVLNM